MTDAIDWTLYAQLSDIVYDRGVGNEPVVKPSGADRVQSKRDGSFYGEVYQIGSNFVVAIRGTDDPSDFTTNIPYGLGDQGFTNQLADTLALVKDAETRAGQTGGSVSLTGHSLSGGLAALAGAYSNHPAYVFDPAPFNKASHVVLTQSMYDSDIFKGITDPLDVDQETLYQKRFQESVDQNVRTIYLKGEVLGNIPVAPSFNSSDPAISTSLDVGSITGPDAAVGLHSMSLLSLIEVSLTTPHGDAPTFDALLRNDRVLREDLVAGGNAGIAGPLGPPPMAAACALMRDVFGIAGWNAAAGVTPAPSMAGRGSASLPNSRPSPPAPWPGSASTPTPRPGSRRPSRAVQGRSARGSASGFCGEVGLNVAPPDDGR